jgi:hypothetical protein
MKNKAIKAINAKLDIQDEAKMIIDHCISDSLPDRVDDVMNTEGWETSNYLANPVVLENHDYALPAVGKCLKLYIKENQLRAVTQFADTEKGKMYYNLYKNDFQRAFSVGFNPIEYKPNKSGGYDYIKQELLEYSCVTVPCNPRATKNLKMEASNMDLEKLKELLATLKENIKAVEDFCGIAEEKEEDPIEEPVTEEPAEKPIEEPVEEVIKEEVVEEEIVKEVPTDEQEIPEEEVEMELQKMITAYIATKNQK